MKTIKTALILSILLLLASGLVAAQPLAFTNVTVTNVHDGITNISGDTVHVAPPTGERDADRASILAALEQVESRGTIQFAPGTYLLGGFIPVSVSGVTLLGHRNGTTLRGCDPAERSAPDSRVRCNTLALIGSRQVVRNLTFEYMSWGLLVGFVVRGNREHVFHAGEGGHLIEGNSFRDSGIGVRVAGDWPEAVVVRRNRFVNTYHAGDVAGRRVHFLDNDISAPDPARVLPFRHVGHATQITPLAPAPGDVGLTAAVDCEENVIAGNRYDGHPDAIVMYIDRAGSCRDNVIRDNTIIVRRARFFGDRSSGGIRHENDSTLVGIPLVLANWGEEHGTERRGVIENNVIEGNRIIGAEGLGLKLYRASRNRVADNTITRIRRREPFPGNVLWGIDEEQWRHANGSGIWVSAGSNGNEIVNNTFEDIASAAVYLEGKSNRVKLSDPADSVRDLGIDNLVSNSKENKKLEYIESQTPTVNTSPPDTLEVEARRFMAGYAADLLSHDSDAIAARYSRRGTYLVYPGDWNLQPHDSIASMYREGWQGPDAFEWDDLSYEVMGDDAVAVIGGFRFVAEENKGFLGTYTALLVREKEELRIRVENESWDNLLLPECAAQEWPCDLPLDHTAMKRYTGKYKVPGQEDSARVYVEDGNLKIHSPGFPPMRLLFQGSDQFRLADYPAVRLMFEGSGENAETYILHRGWVLGTGKRNTSPKGHDRRDLDLDQTALKDMILSQTNELAASWDRLEPDDYLARFSDDLVFYFQGSRVDRDEFELIVRETIKSLSESTFEILNPEVVVLGPDAASITFELNEVLVEKSGTVTKLRGMLTLIYHRRDGEWLVVRAHESLRTGK